MKKILIGLLFIELCSCNNANNSNNGNDSAKLNADTTIHPNGVNEGAVISADTAAYKIKDSTKNDSLSKEQK
ncbi:MAG: hypothetical protein ACR2FN_07040 [Chitinophagaceae bacterium]